jgi:hypothetical protein
MRIQETDRILKESRHARNAAASQQHQQEEGGVFSRALRMITKLFHRHS